MIGKIIERVNRDMNGRMCDEHDNVRLLMEAVRDAGDGDYLEIGVLHGGSLCAVGLLKKQLKHKSRCYGIDPLDGYYTDHKHIKKRGRYNDPVTRLPVDYNTVISNLEKFGITDRVTIIQSRSNPLPFYGSVAVCYIDGDHWGDAPTIDWCNINPLVTRFVVFDNVCDKHPDVKMAVDHAQRDVRWRTYKLQGITAIMERVR